MRTDTTIVAESRASRGKNEARRLRARGLSPAIVYGTGKEPASVSVNPKEVNKLLHSKSGFNTIFNLSIADQESIPVMVVDTQVDPIKGRLLHIDLKRIDLSKRIAVRVPVHTVGEPKGVKLQGGLLEAVTREIEIECLPDEIPEGFTMDVAELAVGQSIRASDVPLTGSMKLVSSGDTVISHVVSLKAEAEPEVAAVAEPEVIKKGKKDEVAAPDAAAKPAAKPPAKKK